MKNVFLIPASIFPLVLFALLCSCNTGPDGGSALSGEPLLRKINFYYLDSLGIEATYIESYCDVNNATPTRDTVTFPEAYALSGNTLVENNPDELGDNGTVIETVTLTRGGSGTGLQGGVWKVQSIAFPVVSGSDGSGNALDANDRAEVALDSELAVDLSADEQAFTADGLYEYGSVQPAKAFVANWKGNPDVAPDSIAVTAVSQYVARLQGLRTGEIVTVTYSADVSVITFTSSAAAHAKDVFHAYAESCPDDPLPGWFSDFLQANQNANGDGDYTGYGLAKKRAGPQRFSHERFSRELF